MRLLPSSSLLIPPNRQRREFDPQLLSDLAESIKTNQLLNPLTTRTSTEGVVLVAGERRKRAIEDYIWATGESFRFGGEPVPEGMLPCSDMGELTPLQAEEAELEENLRRTDLSWQEEATALARLADLRNAQAEARGDPPVPIAEIAREVTGRSDADYHTKTRNKIILARNLDVPEVRAAGNAKEAFKILKRQEERVRNAALAESVGRTFSSSAHTLLCEDSIEWLEETAEDGRYDVIITDPPYGVGADEYGDSGGKAAGAHRYQDDDAAFVDTHRALIAASSRITKSQAHLYLFCDIDRFVWIREALGAEGWWVHRTPLIWHKTNGSRIPWPEHGPQRKYELILYAVKGKRITSKVGSPDIIPFPSDTNLGNSAQKPIALYTELLRRSVQAGNEVLDPFMGTGPIIPAAHSLKCKATGLDKDPSSYGIAVGRLKLLDGGAE